MTVKKILNEIKAGYQELEANLFYYEISSDEPTARNKYKKGLEFSESLKEDIQITNHFNDMITKKFLTMSFELIRKNLPSLDDVEERIKLIDEFYFYVLGCFVNSDKLARSFSKPFQDFLQYFLKKNIEGLKQLCIKVIDE